MDIARPHARRRRLLRVLTRTTATLGLLTGLTVAFELIGKMAPRVGRSTLSVDTVRRDDFVRQVRGPGQLIPQRLQRLTASADGTVARLVAEPGALVEEGAVIAELANAEVTGELRDAEQRLRSARAQLARATARHRATVAARAAELARIDQDLRQSVRELRTSEGLRLDGADVPVDDLLTRCQELRAERTEARGLLAEARRAQSLAESAASDQVSEREARAVACRERAAQLIVVAPIAGVVQKFLVAVDQPISAGGAVADLVDPVRLRAEVRLDGSQAREVRPGLLATVDTHNGRVPARVVEVAPAAASVTVTLALEGTPAAGLRPDLAVDAVITVEQSGAVLTCGRPALVEPDATVGLFKVNGRSARRVPVHIGRTSATAIEILEGLAPGDQVILSDTSVWNRYDSLRLD